MPEYNVKVQFERKPLNVLCSEDQDFISASRMYGIDLSNSCYSGVCMSCASTILEGFVEQEDLMGLNDVLINKGFALLCVSYPKKDLDVVIGDQIEHDLYNGQFGKYQ